MSSGTILKEHNLNDTSVCGIVQFDFTGADRDLDEMASVHQNYARRRSSSF